MDEQLVQELARALLRTGKKGVINLEQALKIAPPTEALPPAASGNHLIANQSTLAVAPQSPEGCTLGIYGFRLKNTFIDDVISEADPTPEHMTKSCPVMRWGTRPRSALQSASVEERSEGRSRSREAASSGSVWHGTGRCRPCAWFWKPTGCKNGRECEHCHLCPEGELKARRKEKSTMIKLGLQGVSSFQADQDITLSTEALKSEALQRDVESEQTVSDSARAQEPVIDPRPEASLASLSEQDRSWGLNSVPSVMPVKSHPELGSGTVNHGSSLHGTGRCRPCAWFWKPGGCMNGDECGHCHLCPEGEIRARKKGKSVMAKLGLHEIHAFPKDQDEDLASNALTAGVLEHKLLACANFEQAAAAISCAPQQDSAIDPDSIKFSASPCNEELAASFSFGSLRNPAAAPFALLRDAVPLQQRLLEHALVADDGPEQEPMTCSGSEREVAVHLGTHDSSEAEHEQPEASAPQNALKLAMLPGLPARVSFGEEPTQGMPSLGSALHGTGGCTPCAWFWKPGGCHNGPACGRCHRCPVGEVNARKKLKINTLRRGAAVVSMEGIACQATTPPSLQALKLTRLDACRPECVLDEAQIDSTPTAFMNGRWQPQFPDVSPTGQASKYKRFGSLAFGLQGRGGMALDAYHAELESKMPAGSSLVEAKSRACGGA